MKKLSKIKLLWVVSGLLFYIAGLVWAGTLVTVETEKARLTIELLKRFVQLEHHLRKKQFLQVLILAPETRTAFQDQNLVNEAVLEKIRQIPFFQAKVVRTPKEALASLLKQHYDIFYIAGPVEDLSKIVKLSEKKRVFTVSHLPELVSVGVVLSLDLERRRACILVNKNGWQKLGFKIDPTVMEKICFVSGPTPRNYSCENVNQ